MNQFEWEWVQDPDDNNHWELVFDLGKTTITLAEIHKEARYEYSVLYSSGTRLVNKGKLESLSVSKTTAEISLFGEKYEKQENHNEP